MAKKRLVLDFENEEKLISFFEDNLKPILGENIGMFLMDQLDTVPHSSTFLVRNCNDRDHGKVEIVREMVKKIEIREAVKRTLKIPQGGDDTDE